MTQPIRTREQLEKFSMSELRVECDRVGAPRRKSKEACINEILALQPQKANLIDVSEIKVGDIIAAPTDTKHEQAVEVLEVFPDCLKVKMGEQVFKMSCPADSKVILVKRNGFDWSIFKIDPKPTRTVNASEDGPRKIVVGPVVEIDEQAEAIAPEQYEVGYKAVDEVEVVERDGIRNVMINGELAGQYWYDESQFGNPWVMKAGDEEWTFAAPMQAENTITYNFRTNRTPLVQTEEITATVEIEKAIAIRSTDNGIEVILGTYEENLDHAQAFMGFYTKFGATAILTPVRYLHTYDFEMVFRGLPHHTITSFRQTFGRGHNDLTAKKERPTGNVFETDVPNVYAVWSGDERYTVTVHDDECTCSCPHYRFRHQQPSFVDKHIEAVKNAISKGDVPPELVKETKHTYRVNAPIEAKYLNLDSYGEWQNELDWGYRYSNYVDAMFQRNPIKIGANRLKVGDRLGYYRVDEIVTCSLPGGYTGLRFELLPLDYQEVVVGDDHATMYRQMDERRKHREKNLKVIECFDHNLVAI